MNFVNKFVKVDENVRPVFSRDESVVAASIKPFHRACHKSSLEKIRAERRKRPALKPYFSSALRALLVSDSKEVN